MKPVLTLIALSVAAWLVPAAAQAQPSTGTIFVSASGFADIRRAPTSNVQGGPDDDASGTAPGGALGIGVHLTRRLSARVEWSLTDTLSLDRNSPIYPYAVEDLVARVGRGAGFALPPTTLLVPQRTTEERDVKAGFALLGYHLGGGRASIELVGGLGLVNERVTTITEIDLPGMPRGPGFRSEYETSAHHAVPVVGADAAVSLTSHAALVPQLRAYVLNGALQVRPGLGLRWTF
ncbi:MAG: hypothetical protein AB7H93_20360 [Vicinamibacterales bacterium]